MTKERPLSDDLPYLVARLNDAVLRMAEAESRHGIPMSLEIDDVNLVAARLSAEITRERERKLESLVVAL